MSCPACFMGFVHDGEPKGSVVEVENQSYYLSPSPTPNAPILLYFPDVFGASFKNAKLLADTYAAGGFNVYVLDIFLGHDLPATTLSFLESEGFLSKLALPFSFLWAAPTLVSWFRTHGLEANVKPRAHAAAAALGALARQQGVPLYSVGFCFGGRYAALVAAPSGGQPAAVQACVAAHPSFLSDAEAAAVSVPSLYCVVGSDQFTQAHATKAAAAQGAGGLPQDRQAKAIVYKGVGHGFAVRGGPSTTEARAKCAADVIAFLKGLPSA